METIPKPAMGKKLKARAPLPPTQATVHKPSMEQRSFSESYVSGNQSVEDVKENMLPRKMDLSIYLPDGQEKAITVDGSKAVMDLLVDLCSQYHLNPAQHVLEVKFGASQQPLTLRPNTLIGTLDVDTVYLKEKVTEVKPRKPPPRIPEKTVRLIVNFLGTQKAVVRVNPEVPLQSILPSICEKCEFNHENVILLSDSISKEELDMAKSLKDLGIKELYVWNSKQEKNRSLSTSSDNTEKEKKGILGFFRSYKKSSKNEGNVGVVDKEDYEEVFKIASTSGNNSEGFSTAPSSPSVNSRPIAFGASLSLSNISGIGAKPEMKKRRAPPPPKPAPQEVVFEKNMEQKIPEQLSSTIQNEEQKKKRRAPPPPTSQVPNAVNEEEENRKSTTGNERQVPQKPPRGTTRSPPQLEIPPPPPYPPPEYNIMDSPVYENGAVITGPTTFVPVPAKHVFLGHFPVEADFITSLILIAGLLCGSALYNGILKKEDWLPDPHSLMQHQWRSDSRPRRYSDTLQESPKHQELQFGAPLRKTVKGEKSLIRCNSVSSEEVLTAESIEAEEAESLNSFTGDSGMASSPSDIVSLGLHNDNTKSKENTLNQDNAKEKVENCKPKLHLERSDSYNVDESSSPQRKRDDDVASVRNGDEDIFIAAQLDKTLEEFNEDSEGIDDADDAYSHHIHSSSTPVEEEISSYKYDAGTDVRVPVTIIDEVPDMNIYSVKTTEDKTSSKKEYSIQKTSAQTQTEDKTNNNTNVSDGVSEKNGTGKTFNFASNTPRGKSYTNNTKTDMLTSPTSARNEFNTNVNTTDKYENDSRESKSPISSSAKAKIELRSVKEKTESFIENKQAIEKVKNEKEPISTQKNISIKATEPTKPTVWRQQPYEPKVGMTTFTVVPPKPDVKKYDRGASLSASAIKIDDFGNLISPHSSQDKKYIYESLSNETEGPLVERAKEFWRSNSIDAQAGDSKEQPVKKFSSMKSNSSKPNLQDPENNPLRNYLSSKGAPQTFMKTEDFKGHPVKNVLISSNKPNCQEQKNRENHSSPNDLTPQIPINKFPVRDSGLQQTKQIQATTAVPQEKMIIIEHTSTNKGRTDLPFLKPQKRTSSQYVASAISKYTEPSNNKISETKSDQSFPEINSVKDRNILVEEKKVGNGNADKRETTIEPKTMFIGSNIQGRDRISKMDTVNKFSFVNEQPPINAKCSTSEYQNVNGSQSINGNKSISIFEKKNEKTNSVYSPLEPQVRLSTGPSNAFLKAVREKSGKIEQANSFGFHKEQTRSVNITEKESKPDIIPSTIIDEPDNLVNSDIFGPKAKFRPVVQKPAQQDTSLHSALMGAIQSGEGKEKLRKIQSSPTNGVEKKFPEPENERSALLSAIRAHNGTSTLKKVSSAASNELQAIRNIDSSIKNEEKKQTTHQSIPPPPFMPPPPPPTMLTSAPKVSPTIINNSVNAREALMEAIRSGTGASRLKKVSASVRTL